MTMKRFLATLARLRLASLRLASLRLTRLPLARLPVARLSPACLTLTRLSVARLPLACLVLACLALACPALAGNAQAEDHVTFGLDWRAEAEYGGYYQAVATGLYARHGLSVSIQQGGPQVNHMQLLMAGRLDFNLGGGRAVEFVQQNLPFLAVAAIFQKDPAVLLAHPGVGNDSFPALKGKPIEIGTDTRSGWWLFLAKKFGYSDSQIRPYTFNLAPFLANKEMVQQGYLGSEPYLIKQAAGFDPVVLLIADAGYPGYANIITTSDKLVAEKPDLVQRFIDGSIEGWYSYLYQDPSPADKMILAANPEMTQSLLDYGRRVMIEHGTVDSGDARTLGIGAMTDARWVSYYQTMSDVGVYAKGLDIRKAYTTRFVDHRVGIDMRPASAQP